jgi:hypothetical protein
LRYRAFRDSERTIKCARFFIITPQRGASIEVLGDTVSVKKPSQNAQMAQYQTTKVQPVSHHWRSASVKVLGDAVSVKKTSQNTQKAQYQTTNLQQN